jgi:DNA-binding FadR family transcriptional regulator
VVEGTGVTVPTKASLAIAAEFRSRIARGDLRAGEPLPVESELMDELGVSKGVVREALRILETEGLVEVRRGLGGGPRVRHPSISEAAKAIGVYLQIGDVLVTDVWETRDRIIGGAVERLAVRTDGRDLGVLEESVDALATLVGDFDAYYPQLVDVGEKAVLAAGSATEHVIVVSLRHIIAAELEAATRAVVDVAAAVEAEETVTQAWADTLRHVRAGRPAAARRAYQRQADMIRTGLWAQMKDATVGEIAAPRPPEPQEPPDPTGHPAGT